MIRLTTAAALALGLFPLAACTTMSDGSVDAAASSTTVGGGCEIRFDIRTEDQRLLCRTMSAVLD